MKTSARGSVSLGGPSCGGKHAKLSRISHYIHNKMLAGPLWIDHRAVPRKGVMYVDVLAVSSLWGDE
jgi:hypothetical protein